MINEKTASNTIAIFTMADDIFSYIFPVVINLTIVNFM